MKELLYEVHIHVIGQEIARIFDQFSLVIDHWQEEGKKQEREQIYRERNNGQKERETCENHMEKERESCENHMDKERDRLSAPPPSEKNNHE